MAQHYARLTTQAEKNYHIRTRSGYRPRINRHFVQAAMMP